MELKWSVDQYKDILIPYLGGLHIAMSFLGVHGLRELWVECDVLGVNVAQNVISGKGYAPACQDTQSHIAGIVAITTPITECTPGLC